LPFQVGDQARTRTRTIDVSTLDSQGSKSIRTVAS
jgi:hypothetical protein